MFVWSIPDEMVHFIGHQFVRFNAPYPKEKAIDEIGDFVLSYVSKHDYFPRSPSEAMHRFQNPHEGLSEPEKLSLCGPLEIILKTKLFIDISFEQIHLATWAALLWCWSEEGEIHVRFSKKTQA